MRSSSGAAAPDAVDSDSMSAPDSSAVCLPHAPAASSSAAAAHTRMLTIRMPGQRLSVPREPSCTVVVPPVEITNAVTAPPTTTAPIVPHSHHRRRAGAGASSAGAGDATSTGADVATRRLGRDDRRDRGRRGCRLDVRRLLLLRIVAFLAGAGLLALALRWRWPVRSTGRPAACRAPRPSPSPAAPAASPARPSRTSGTSRAPPSDRPGGAGTARC